MKHKHAHIQGSALGCGCDVTSCIKFWWPWLFSAMLYYNLEFWLSSLSLLNCFSSEYFITVTGMEAGKLHPYERTHQKATWILSGNGIHSCSILNLYRWLATKKQHVRSEVIFPVMPSLCLVSQAFTGMCSGWSSWFTRTAFQRLFDNAKWLAQPHEQACYRQFQRTTDAAHCTLFFLQTDTGSSWQCNVF